MNQAILSIKYYVVGEEVSFDEARYLELKGHRSITSEEIPPQCINIENGNDNKDIKSLNSKKTMWASERRFTKDFKSRQSRQPITKTVNAFLNSGHGGIVLVGITDDGIVRGIKLNEYQKDHVRLSLIDALDRFKPPVPRSRYKLRFIPVVEDDTVPVERYLNFKYPFDPNIRGMRHQLRTYKYCWCDNESRALVASGILPPSYVIEIVVYSWDAPDIDLNSIPESYYDDDITLPDIHLFCPVFETENRKCCFKKSASVVSYTPQQVYEFTIELVRRYFLEEINRLDRRIAELKKNRRIQEYLQMFPK